MLNLCNKCGMCCKAIMIGKDKDAIDKMALNDDINDSSGNYSKRDRLTDSQFISRNWVQVDAKHVMTTNPFLYKSLIKNMINGMAKKSLIFPPDIIHASMNAKLDWFGANRSRFSSSADMYFYKCTKHDPVTNECTVHAERPRVCSAYPMYGREELSKDEQLYDENCGYKEVMTEPAAEELLEKIRNTQTTFN